jgi:uncharacterized protein DUF4399
MVSSNDVYFMELNMTYLKIFAAFLFLTMTSSLIADDHISKSNPGANLYFISPTDDATVSKTFTVKFGLSGMGVAPAGIDKDNTGHHHLLINMDQLPDLSQPLGASDNIKHFGGGQTETELTLTPGTYTLQLVLGNHLHIPHDKPVISEKITITVE